MPARSARGSRLAACRARRAGPAAVRGARPQIAGDVSVRPAPIRPPMPRISPRRSSKQTSLTRSPSAIPSTLRQHGRQPACRCAAGRGRASRGRPSRRPRRASSRQRSRRDVAPVAQHGDAVAEREDLGHAVADVDDADAPRLQVAHDAEQRLRLGLGQRGGRLVEDQHPAVERQRLGDLDQLLAGDRQFADARGCRHRVQPGQHRSARAFSSA